MAVATSLASPSDASPIILHRLVARRLRAGVFVVMRLDGASAIRVDEFGAEAIRLIRRLRTPAAVQNELHRRHGGTYDISEIVKALRQARMIRRWGDVRLNQDRLRPANVLLCLWRGWFDWDHRIPTLICRTLPPRLAAPLAGSVRRRKIGAALRGTAAEEFERRLPVANDPRDLAERAARHTSYLTRGDVLARVACETRPAALHAWLTRDVVVSGAEHLLQARETAPSVIVALLHQGPFPVIIPKLMSMGFPVHSFNFGVDFATRPFDEIMAEASRALGYPASRSYPTASPSNLSAYLRGLSTGGVGLVTLDYYAQVQSFSVKPEQTANRGARNRRETAVEVSFGRRTMLIHTFAGWLARRAEAAVVPCACTWTPEGKLCLTFRPAVTLTRGSRDDAQLTREMFAAFAPDILARPEEWTFLLRYVPGPNAFAAAPLGVTA